jgi:23S rRNA pseudouridine2605 synthase
MGQRVTASARIDGSKTKTVAQNPRRRPQRAKIQPSEPRKGERLQKILASAGVAARRSCEQIILDGRVQVNGVTVAELGAKADPMNDEITVDFVPIQKEKPVYILLNKPKGYVTTVRDNEGRPTVMALLGGISARVFPVGRLDFNSEGILLMTNDGELAQHLASPASHVPKTYLVKVHRLPKPETLDELRAGFRLSGKRLRPCQIQFADRQSNPWLKITLTEGKNQQIRKMFAAVGHPVHKLKRVQFGPLADPALKPGQWRLLTPDELAVLKNMYV